MFLPEEWQYLEAATEAGPGRFGMVGGERLVLYCTAIQTGLRSAELRSLTGGRLFLDADPPYITCKAGSTKNRKNARQYIQPELAVDLKAHIATKAPVFGLPHESNLARMLRSDLSDARTAWLNESRDLPDEYVRREQSDFLASVNHDGEVVDFHSLRHTCGAWLAMADVLPASCATGDAARLHHADDGHIRAPIPGSRSRRGSTDARNPDRSTAAPATAGDRHGRPIGRHAPISAAPGAGREMQ